MTKIIYLSDLPQGLVKLAQDNHSMRIANDGIYTEEEIQQFVEDLPNQKIGDLGDALDEAIYDYIHMYAKDELDADTTYYALYDLQNQYEDSTLHTFGSARQWLADFWENNPDDDMDDDDIAQLVADILASDLSELGDRLGGVGYYLQEIKLKN